MENLSIVECGCRGQWLSSEAIPQAELDLARGGPQAGDLAEIGVVHGAGRISEVDLVGHVEELCAEFHSMAFTDWESFFQCHVDANNAVGIGDECACVPERV